MDDKRTVYTEKYYTAMNYLEKRYHAVSRQMRFKAATSNDYALWKNILRNELIKLSGLYMMKYCSLNPVIREKTVLNGYIRESIII